MHAVLALLSGLLWGTADFAGGLLSRRLRAVAVVAGTQAVGLGLAVLVLLATGGVAPDGWSWWAPAAGACGGLGLLTFYAALASGSMGVVSPIAALGSLVPVVVGLASGDRPTALQVAGMVLALAGAVAASGPELSGGAGARSIGLAVVAGCLFGSTLVGLDRAAGTSIPLTLAAMRGTSLLIMSGSLAVVRWRSGPAGAPTGTGVPRLDAVLSHRAGLVAALVLTGGVDVVANLTFAVASRGALSSVVSVLGGLYPVATVALALVVLHERWQRVQAAGVVAALAGAALLAT